MSRPIRTHHAPHLVGEMTMKHSKNPHGSLLALELPRFAGVFSGFGYFPLCVRMPEEEKASADTEGEGPRDAQRGGEALSRAQMGCGEEILTSPS